jgi:peroxiredoxin
VSADGEESLGVSLVLVRVLLAAVFLVAGVAKLADRAGVRRMVVEFGSPASLAAPLAWGLACCELGVAVALLFGRSARASGLAALVLLIGFAAAVAISVSRGRRPECHCFGRFRVSEVGWSTIVRNALLATGAAFIAADGRFEAAFVALAVTSAGAWITLAVRGSRELRPGAPAPALSLPDLDGRTRTLGSLLAGESALLLVFSDPDCGACQELMPQLAGWQPESLDPALTVAVVSATSDADLLRTMPHPGVGAVLLDEHRAVAAAYGVTATPSAILVDAERRIAAVPAVGGDEIIGLVARTIAGTDEARFARRALLARAAVGLAGVTVVPLIESAVATARSVERRVRPKRLKIDGAWLCDQRYALCTSAACKPSKTNPNVSVCRCKVTHGYAVGFKSCEQRAPKGRQLHSNFSLQGVSSRTRVLKCSNRGLWVQCLDVVCEIDRDDPKHASCQCVNMKTKNFYTFGGDCDTKTCKSVIWSATTAPFPGGAQYEKGLKRLGVPFRSPKSCPTPRTTK